MRDFYPGGEYDEGFDGYDDSGNDAVAVEHDGIMAETEKAVCFRIEDADQWVPKSQIFEHNHAEVCLKRWFAEKESLPYKE